MITVSHNKNERNSIDEQTEPTSSYEYSSESSSESSGCSSSSEASNNDPSKKHNTKELISAKRKKKLKNLTTMGLFRNVHKFEVKWRDDVERFCSKIEAKEEEIREKEERRKSRRSVNTLKRIWHKTYHRQHPRRLILEFFNDVAREGANDIENSGKVKTKNEIHPMLRYFDRASIFTVWRPTSMDAMIKMIRNEGIGKDLDIKGKSALKGKLSGFVPFLQIGTNEDKDKVILPPNGTIRIYFKGEDGCEARNLAIERLRLVAETMSRMEFLEKIKHGLDEIHMSLSADRSAAAITGVEFEEEPKLSKVTTSLFDSIQDVDDFFPTAYGIEIPIRLFWEAFVAHHDISTDLNSIYDIGRKSCRTSQNFNISALCNTNISDDHHRVVLVQTANTDDLLNPFELLMSYELEEKDDVLPVVSDCDCFLVGTRRITYKTPIEDDQLHVIKWSISQIAHILNHPSKDDFKKQWFALLEKAACEGFHPKVPRIGFGDPKSSSIMENAVQRLTGTGGVRHGAESFNYKIPQDLEDEFIVIAEGLEDNVTWKKFNQVELQNFLANQIDLGYTFPLNPKWILYDGGRWSELYDKLLASDNQNTIDSMNVWFPPEIRQQIQRIRERFPNGFCVENREETNTLRLI